MLAGSNRSYYLWALQESFSPQARLFDAPFPNVHSGGQICWGNNTPPLASPATAQNAWKLFFESPFNDHLVQGKTRRHSDVRELLVRLNGKNKFPVHELATVQRGTLESNIQRLFRN